LTFLYVLAFIDLSFELNSTVVTINRLTQILEGNN